jgi:hypothetical protein
MKIYVLREIIALQRNETKFLLPLDGSGWK